MNELQIALLAVGAALVGAVWGYNKWQEQKHRKLAEKVFQGTQADALLAEDAPAAAIPVVEPARDTTPDEPVGRLEPAFAPEFVAEPAVVELAEPVEPEPLEPVAEPSAVSAAAVPAAPVDEIADAWIRIEFEPPVAAAALWAQQARWAGAIDKPLSWLAFDPVAQQWRSLAAGDEGRYTWVVAALRLADRRGAVTDSGLAVFLDGVQAVAEALAGHVDIPKHDDVLMHARGLDEFCASVDLQLGVNIVASPSTPFVGTKLRGLAEAAGLTLREGSFHALDDVGQTRFTLNNIGTGRFEAEAMKSLVTHGVTLSLDVPRVANGPAVFDAMLVVARQLTQGLGGSLVDGQGNPLTAEMIAVIRAKVGELQQKMALHQILAGSARAQRLFS